MKYENPIRIIAGKASQILLAEDFFDGAADVKPSIITDNVVHIGFQKAYWVEQEINDIARHMLASVLACHIDVPACPFIYQPPIHANNALDEGMYSIGCFELPITPHIALTNKTYDALKRDQDDYRNFMEVRDSLTPAVQADRMEFNLLQGCKNHLSAVLPFCYWIGENDIGSYNAVVDGRQLLESMAAPKLNDFASDFLRFCKIDYKIRDARHIKYYAENPHEELKSISDQFTDFFSGFPTPHQLTRELQQNKWSKTRPDADRILAICENLARELFSPFINDDIVHDIGERIIACNDQFIRQEALRITSTIGKGLATDQKKQFKKSMDFAVKIIIQRRDKMADYLNARSNTPSITASIDFNPFSAFEEAAPKQLRSQGIRLSGYGR